MKFQDGIQCLAPTLQPVELSLSVTHDIQTSGEVDDLYRTLSYTSFADTLAQSNDAGPFSSLVALTDSIFEQFFETYPEIQTLSIKVTKRQALLQGESVSLHASRSRNSPSDAQESFSFEDMELPVTICVNPEEREIKQMVRMSLTLFGRTSSTSSASIDYRLLAKRIHEVSPSPAP